MRHFFHEQTRIRIGQAGEGCSEASIEGRNQAQDAPADEGKEETVEEMKICSKCKIKKSLSEFYADKTRNSGLSNLCNICVNEKRDLWIKNNQEKNSATTRLYRKNNAKKIIAKKKLWRLNNPEKVKAKRKRWKIKYLSTIKGCLDSRMATSIWMALKKSKAGQKWKSLVGYSVKDLRGHLENQFTGGMTWDAFMRGEIHIDHIIPKSRFHYEKPEDPEFKICWGLANLQPLWAIDNFAKHNKTMDEFLLIKKGISP